MIAGPGLAQPPAVSLRPHLRPKALHKLAVTGSEALVADAGLSGKVAFAVADVTSGLVLETREAAVGLPPASVTKTVTALYALDRLGPAHRFRTRLIAAGPVQNGILQGDLVLAGGGDPTLDTDALAEMAAKLKAAGLREVRGKFLVWGGALPYARQIDADQPDHVGYNPAVSGLALNFNRVHFEWRRAGAGWGVSMDARTARYRPEVEVASMAIMAREVPVYTYRAQAGNDRWTVASGALGNGGARWLPVRNPDKYAAEVFRTFARAQGIVLKPEAVVAALPAGTTLVTQESEPLREILRGMLKHSTNLTAEMVGLAASQAQGGRVASIRASASAMSRWANQTLGMTGARLVDHSGLGEASELRAGDLVKALVAAQKSGVLKPLLKDITLRNAKGQPNRAHPLKVKAKTGTLNFVSALAGYLTATDGTEMAFAIFTADEPRRAKIPRAERERPRGARTWNGRSKRLQQKLLERWGVLYGS